MANFRCFSILFLLIIQFPSSVLSQTKTDQLVKDENDELLSKAISIPYDKYTGDLYASNQLFEKALEIALSKKDSASAGEIYTRISIVCYLLGDYDKSMEYNHAAIEVFNALGDNLRAGNAYCQIGYQMKRQNLERAFYYMRKGISMLIESDSTQYLRGPYDNYGVLHELAGNYDSALFFYNKALSIKQELYDSIGIPFSLNNIAQTNMLLGEFEKAKPFLDEAFFIRQKRNDVFGIIENYNFYGDFYFKQKKYKTAISFYESGIELAKEANYLYLWQYISGRLSVCYEKMDKYALALQYQREQQKINDSILNSETNQKMAQLEVQFKTAEKEKELALVNEEKALVEIEVYNRNKIIFGIIALIVIGTLIFLLLFQRYRQRQQALLNKTIIQEKELAIKAVIEAEERERNRIARELHDGIGQQMSGLKMAWQGFRNKFLKDDIEALSESERLSSILDNSSSEVRSISHQMMPKALKEVGLEAAISDILNALFKNSTVRAQFTSHGIKKRFGNAIEITVFRVFQELVNNTIKYAQAQNIDVQLYVIRNELILMVEDDGVGFSIEQQKAGIGLMNIRIR
ncbi:MAG: histidine kinase, partial [Bacteroidales bacterium]